MIDPTKLQDPADARFLTKTPEGKTVLEVDIPSPKMRVADADASTPWGYYAAQDKTMHDVATRPPGGAPWEQEAAPAGGPDVAAPEAPLSFGIDWSQPVSAVREQIGALPPEVQPAATKQWAEAYVAQETKDLGAWQTIADTARAAARGTLVGSFADEANAYTQDLIYSATGGVLGAPYDETAAYNRARDRAFDEAHPAMSLTAQVAGGMASATPVLSAPKTLGQVAVRGGAAGGTYAGVSGVGNAEGSLTERLPQGARNVPIGVAGGAILAPALSKGTEIVGDAYRYATGRGLTKNVDKIVARQLEKDNIAIRELEKQAGPLLSSRARVLTDPYEIVAAQDMLNAGVDLPTVARRFNTTVDTLQKRMNIGAGETPMSLLDLAKSTRVGAGANVAGTARGAAAISGPGKAKAQEMIWERQVAQQERLSNAVDRFFGKIDVDAAKDAFSAGLRKNAKVAYDALYQEPDLLTKELTPIIGSKALQRFWTEAREILLLKENIDIGAKPGQYIPVRALDYIYRTSRDAASTAFKEGRTSLGDALKDMSTRIRDLADKNYSAYPQIRATYSDAKRVLDALEMGQNLALRPGAAREATRLIKKMSDQERTLVALGFTQKIRDEIYGPSAGTNIADRMLRKGAQDVFKALLPPKDADAFIEVLKKERVTTQTLREFLGSRTTPLAEDIKEFREAVEGVGDVLQGRFGKLLENVYNRYMRGVTEANAERIIERLLETDPARLRTILSELSGVERRLASEEVRRIAGSLGLTKTAINIIAGAIATPRDTGDKAAQMRVMNEFREKGKELGSQRRLTDNLDRINEKSKTGIFQTGVVSPRKFATMLGMSLSDLDLKGDAEPSAFFEALNGMTPSDLVVKMKGAVTPPEWAGFLQALPDMMSSKEGNAALFETMRVIHARQAAVSAMAGRRQRAGQGLDESFLDEMRSAREANPMPFNLPVSGAPNG